MTNLPDGYYKAALPESALVLGEVRGGRFESVAWRGSVSYMLDVGWVFTRLIESTNPTLGMTLAWLTAAVQSPSFKWDPDQLAAARETADALLDLIPEEGTR